MRTKQYYDHAYYRRSVAQEEMQFMCSYHDCEQDLQAVFDHEKKA